MRFICILLLIFESTLLNAQKNTQNGYIITNQYDTLFGLVTDRKEDTFTQIYKKIRFKNHAFFTKRYGPNQIVGYRIGENQYVSLWFTIRTKKFEISYLSLPGMGEKVFLRAIVFGDLNYYQLEWLDQESGVVESIPLFKRVNDSYMVRVTQGVFGIKIKSMTNYFHDCPILLEKLSRSEFKNPEEMAVFYNQFCGNKKLKNKISLN